MPDDVVTGQVLDPDAAENTTTVVAGKEPPKDAPAFTVTDDGNIVQVGDKKYMREEAVKEARAKAQEYASTLDQLKPLMPEFEQFLEQKRAGKNATVNRATRGAESDYSEDELQGYAITRGYYDKDNKPDVRRAQDDLDIMTAIADRRASKAVKPVADGTVRDRARENVERALNYRLPVDGDPVADPKYLQAVIEALPEETRADASAMDFAQVIAAGLEALDARKGGRRRGSREPIFREGSGQRFSGGGEQLDALDRAAARARGKTPEAWAKLQKDLGGSAAGGTVLEDIN